MDELILKRECSGRCGSQIEYPVVIRHSDEKYDGVAPEVRVKDGLVAYAGGHLCPECAAVVREALASRRRPNAPETTKWRASGLRWNKGGLRQ